MEIDINKLQLNQLAGIMTGVLGILGGFILQSYLFAFCLVSLGVGMAGVSLEESGIKKSYLTAITIAVIAAAIFLAGVAIGQVSYYFFN